MQELPGRPEVGPSVQLVVEPPITGREIRQPVENPSKQMGSLVRIEHWRLEQCLGLLTCLMDDLSHAESTIVDPSFKDGLLTFLGELHDRLVCFKQE